MAGLKCNVVEPLKLVNGRPSVPILDEQLLPEFLHSKRLESSVNRSNTRLELFSGLANPALAKVNSDFISRNPRKQS
ncbi:hypothetical protein SOVF_139230 [Spinacia oleracea]|nr:hypothetical protein SOVF_139230 [Spinacia oleracea]